MITKKTYPVMDGNLVKKTVTEYRIFGILLLRKELEMPKPGTNCEYIYKI